MKTISQQLEPKINARIEKKWFPLFEKQARYQGNGIYSVPQTNLFSTDTRELFLMFAACKEGIKYKTGDENSKEDE